MGYDTLVTEEAMTRKTAMTAKAKSATGATSQTAKTTKATAPKEKAKKPIPLIHQTRSRQQTKMPIPSFRAFKKEMLPEKMYR